jgi:hypothetical protein
MAEYYKNRPSTTMPNVPGPASNINGAAVSTETLYMSEYDKQRDALLSDDLDEGWASELRRYLGVVQRDVKKDTDLVEWWQVSNLFIFIPSSLAINSLLHYRTTSNYSQLLLVSHSMYFHLKHLQLPASGFSQAVNKLQLIVDLG